MKDRSAFWWNVAAAVVLLLAIVVLTPRYWEPGSESWKRWAAARILLETGGFPMFSANPLYTVYLMPFLPLGFPLSVRVEFVLTHFFALAAIYRMLSAYSRRPLALLLTCAWLPSLAVVEGGATVAGIGFLALYLSRPRSEPRLREELLPASLLAAVLCHSGFLFFLLGHAVGVGFERLRGRPSECAASSSSRVVRTAIKACLAALVLLMLSLPSKRADSNYMLMDTTYAPIAAKDPLTIGFFQIGTWKEVMRKAPASTWVDQDWYFTLDEIYGGARTIGQAFVRRPRVVFANLTSNVPDLLQTPLYFFSGYFRTVFLPTVCIFSFGGLIGFAGMLSRFFHEGRLSYLLAVSFGTASLLAALMLTWFGPRYTLALLPVGLLAVVHLEQGAQRLEAAFRGLGGGRARARGLLFLGAALLLGGLVMNEWTCSVLLRKTISSSARFDIRSLDVMLVLGALVAWAAAARTARSALPAAPAVPRYADVIVCASALLVFATAQYPYGRAAQVEAVLANRGFLSQGYWGAGMATFYPELLRGVTRDTRILAPDDTWLKAFADVDLDKVTCIFGLPPFPDPSGRTAAALRGQDQIWVGRSWSDETHAVSTQAYLRYRLHVAPLLKDLLARGWTRREVKSYGVIYSAPLGGNLL